MIYLKNYLGKRILDAAGGLLGILEDVIVNIQENDRRVRVMALKVKLNGEDHMIAFTRLVITQVTPVTLKCSGSEAVPYALQDRDVRLVSDLVNSQVIDLDRAQVGVVRDFCLESEEENLFVTYVDVGYPSSLRSVMRWPIGDPFRRDRSRNLISWSEVEFLSDGPILHLRVEGKSLVDIQPAELAVILVELDSRQRQGFIEILDAKSMAKLMEKIEPVLQIDIARRTPDEKLTKVLERMWPEDAADLLKKLPRVRMSNLLDLMDQNSARILRPLLIPPQKRTGGSMTAHYTAAHGD